MSDLLDQHRWKLGALHFVYDVTPIENAQMWDIDIVTRSERAVRLVESAIEVGHFRKYKRLLVLGGGAAGVTAAMAGIAHGIRVELRECGPELFNVQRRCRHRFLHPHIYRWPKEGCRSKSYTPRNGVGLSWKAAKANAVVTQWLSQVQQRLHCNDELFRYRPDTESPKLRSVEDFYRYYNENDTRQRFGMVLFCGGMVENLSINGWKGKSFWENDKLDNRSCGLSSEKPRILISGAGDGGLQDLLRILCRGKNIAKLLSEFDKLVKQLPRTTRIRFEKSLRQISDMPPEGHEAIHQECVNLAESLIKNQATQTALKSFLNRVMDVRNKKITLYLAWPSRHFGKCYLLNRFLTVLICKWLERLGCKICVPTARLTNVKEFSRESFEVTFRESDCALQGNRFHLVIPRYGAKWRSITGEDRT